MISYDRYNLRNSKRNNKSNIRFIIQYTFNEYFHNCECIYIMLDYDLFTCHFPDAEMWF